MENYITLTELGILLAFFWLPVFVLAAMVQWRLLESRRRSKLWLLVAFPLEVVLAFAIWVSPLHRFFWPLNFLGPSLQIGAFPLQAALLSAIAVCAFFWAGSRLARRTAPGPRA